MTAAVPAAEGMRRDGVGTGDCEWLLQLGAEAACILLPKKRDGRWAAAVVYAALRPVFPEILSKDHF